MDKVSLHLDSHKSLSVPTWLILLLAITTGLTVSTIYLLQPLLNTVAHEFNKSSESVGLIVTLTQAGYGAGILFLIPLGDALPKKKLILVKLILLILALALTALSPSFYAILLSSLLVGFFATTAQDVVPFAADLALEKERGAVVGKVMSGLLLGILLSRTVSGFLADLLGWRGVFWISASLVAVIGFLIYYKVPSRQTSTRLSYRELLVSTLRNFITYPSLRRAILVQSLIGFAFSAFWTNLSFYVGAEPFHLSPSHIGLFGLAGAIGALAAPIAGKLADRKGPSLGIMVGSALVMLSFLLMYAVPKSLTLLFVGALGFDLGVQMALVSHQSIIYGLNPQARARINALFVTCLFVSFALGSFFSVKLFAHSGWPSVLLLCVGSSALALILSVAGSKPRTP